MKKPVKRDLPAQDGTEILVALPSPRLQLRWDFAPKDLAKERSCKYQCHYELVLPLQEHDIRAEIYKGERVVGKRTELVVPIKQGQLRDCAMEPCVWKDEFYYFDPPFRDGAHAMWDAKLLGNPPIIVIALDGTALRKTEQAA